MITCPKCSKDNQDHYKFCLGCGAELPRDAAPKPFSPQTPPQGMKAAQAVASPAQAPPAAPPRPAPPSSAPIRTAPVAPPPAAAVLASTAAAPAIGGATVVCPPCGHINSPSNLFCGSCGFRVGGAAPRAAAAAPAPAQAPAPATPAVAPAPAAASEAAAGIMALTALRADGSEAGTFQLPNGGATLGRETGGIFAGDSYLSPRHATFKVFGGGRATVKDEASLNGVYKKLARDVPVELRPNDVFRIGQEIVRFEHLTPQLPSADGVERLGAPSKGYVGRIALIVGRDETGNAFPIPESGVHLGRERGDILFPEDGYVSGLHCRLSWDGQKLFLTDLGSSNGTFVRVPDADLRTGDVLLMGQQLFRVAL